MSRAMTGQNQSRLRVKAAWGDAAEVPGNDHAEQTMSRLDI